MPNASSELLQTLLDTLETVNNTDDAPTLNLKMKLVNNIDFVIDSIMEDYINGTIH